MCIIKLLTAIAAKLPSNPLPEGEEDGQRDEQKGDG